MRHRFSPVLLALVLLACTAAAQMPTGVDPAQLQNLERLVGTGGVWGTDPRAASSPRERILPERRPAAEEELRVSNRRVYESLVRDLFRDRLLDDDEKRFLELKARELQIEPREAAELAERVTRQESERFAFLLKQVQALAEDGEVSDDDRRFLVMRARDQGMTDAEGGRLVDRVLEQHRRNELYRSILLAFLEDDLLDASEDKHLEERRKSLGVTEEEHRQALEAARIELRDGVRDVLSRIRARDETVSRVEEKLELYGRKLFEAPADAFVPPEGMPPPDGYRLGPGDEVWVSLWGRLCEEHVLRVDGEGNVQFPKVGAVRVGGLTYAQARALIQARAESITGVSAAVSMGRMRAVEVFVVGEVERPGTVTLSPLSGVVHALMAAGGPTPLGSLRAVSHRRGGRSVGTLDLYAFLQAQETVEGPPLQSGDVVVVPKAPKLVQLHGKVRRPAIYELRGAEGLRALLAYAGGLDAEADAGRIRVDRTLENRSRVTLDASLASPDQDLILQDGDVVRVYPLSSELSNKVSLYGHVYQPGTYTFREGMRAADLLGSAERLKPEVDLDYAVVLRHSGDARMPAVVPFRPGEALSIPDSQENLPLEPRDEVYVFAREQFRSPLRARATGKVRNPGVYRIAEGSRVADLARLAGGLAPDALLNRAEVLRYLPDRTRETLYLNLALALTGDAAQNLVLQDEDELIVHKAWSAVQEPTVLVEGEVFRFKEKVLERQDERARPPFGEAELARGLSIRERLERKLSAEKAAQEEKRAEAEAARRAIAATGAMTPSGLLARQRGGVPAAPGAAPPGPQMAEVALEPPEPPKREEVVALAVPLTRGMTVRDLVFKAGGLTKDAYLPVAHLYRTDPATKTVTIHVFDLGLALAGDPAANLVLQDLDHVVIHSAYDFAPVQRVGASGMVNRPGEYPYAANMRVRDLVLAAGGLTEEAYLAGAEVVRTELLDGETGQTRTLPFDLAAAMAGDPEANLPLEPYDRLFVKKIPEWKRARQVTLEGEITFPGTYHVAKGERLSSVLRRAGGYTAEAYLRGAVFTRESARRQQQQRLDELRDRLQEAVFRASSQEVQAALNPEDVAIQQHFLASQQALLQKLVSIQASGRVVIQLLPIADLVGTEWDVVLEDGDSLAVPERPQTVAVVGQVYNPTSLLWEPDNRRAGYYLQRTGGPTPDAEEKRMYIVRADGTVVSSESEGGANWWTRGGIRSLDLYPGDTVLVPENSCG